MTLSPRDRIHLAALRACVAHVERNRFKAKRRDREAETFLNIFFQGALTAWQEPSVMDITHCAYLVGVRGWREVLSQLHILTQAEWEDNTPHGLMPQEV